MTKKNKDEKPRRKLLASGRKFVRITSELTLKDLKQLAADQPPPKERPDALPLKHIHVAPLVFQWRLPNEELAADEQHVRELVRAIESADPPRALDPIVVTTIGSRFFVVDGHHRIDAYHTVKWKRPVPVRHFVGTLKEAQDAALKANVKNRLPMTRDAKAEAAWRMLIMGREDHAWRRSWTQITDATYVSRSTVKRMARVLKELGAEAAKKSWAEVLRDLRAKQHDEMDADARADWKEEKARELADYLRKGPNLTQDPEITARALAMVSGLIPGQLVSEWQDEAIERLLAVVRECAPEKADAVADVVDALAYRTWPPSTLDETDFPDTVTTAQDLWESL